MKLLREQIENISVSGNKNKGYKISAPFIQAGVVNCNNRIYPYKNIVNNINHYISEMVMKNRAVGELSHPKTPEIQPKEVSHKIISLTEELIDSNRGICNWQGVAKILNTPNGKIVTALLEEDVQLGVSTRALGGLTLTESGHYEVQNNFSLKTAADIVYDPSAPEAFVTALLESKEWIYDEQGLLREMVAEDIKKDIKLKPAKVINENLFNYFQRYLQSL